MKSTLFCLPLGWVPSQPLNRKAELFLWHLMICAWHSISVVFTSGFVFSCMQQEINVDRNRQQIQLVEFLK